MTKPVIYHKRRGRLVQALCPVPKRFLQELVLRAGLKSALDIGCGVASPLTQLRQYGVRTTGVDISAEQIEQAKALNVHDEYLCANFLTHEFPQQYDVVCCSHLIEHFDRDTGWEVLRRLEILASRVLYVETPHGFVEQKSYENNPFQRHLSGWYPHDFQSRGYNIFGSGLRWGAGSGTKPARGPEFLRRQLGRAFSWYIFRRPQAAAAIAAIRYLDTDGDLRQL